MYSIKRTTPDDRDFRLLANALEEELKIRDGEEHLFYATLNQADDIKYTIVLYDNGEPAGCGALRAFEPGSMEIKRMFVSAAKRRKGIASIVLKELEAWCRELQISTCVLETGINQPEAIAFYRLHQYQSIPNFGKYAGSANSVCFKKELIV